MRAFAMSVLALAFVAGCSGSTDSTAATPLPEPAPAAPAAATKAVPSTSPELRLAWLHDADALVAEIEAGPTPLSPAHRARLEDLVASRESIAVWDIDPKAFDESSESTVGVFPRIEALNAVVTSKGTVDDAVQVWLFQHHVQTAFIRAIETYVDGLPDHDATLDVRRAGIERTRLANAIGLCILLVAVPIASDEIRGQVIAILVEEESYAHLGKEHVQLILATLDESIPAALRAKHARAYARIRDAVASAHAAAVPRSDGVKVIYQGIPVATGPGSVMTIISRTGEFAVDAYPAAVASRVVSSGGAVVQHRVEMTVGGTSFQAVCLEGTTAEQLAAQVSTRGQAKVREVDGPGTWFEYTVADSTGIMRIVDIGDLGCTASVEAAPGKLDPFALRFLESLRPAPTAD